MKFITTIILALCFSIPLKAEEFYNLDYKTLEVESYKQPVYSFTFRKDAFVDQYNLYVYADPDNFPISSAKQGSIFSEIFSDLLNDEHIGIFLYYTNGSYEKEVNDYEKVLREEEKYRLGIAGIFAQPYEVVKYSRNEFLYPAIFENNIHLITTQDKKIDVGVKEDLKKYKGVYAKQDKLGATIEKEFKTLNIDAKETFDEAFEALLTGQADFMVGSYYRCQIELYKKGVRKYVNYSSTPIWKVALFFKFAPAVFNHKRLSTIRKYIKSPEFKQKRDKALSEILEYYKENTKGIIPPTYTNTIKLEQTVEN